MTTAVEFPWRVFTTNGQTCYVEAPNLKGAVARAKSLYESDNVPWPGYWMATMDGPDGPEDY